MRGAESTTLLLDRARAGDEAALEVLFARYLAPLCRFASGRLPGWARDLADTQDLVQDVLLQTFKRVGTFESRGQGAFHAYLRQALLNRLRDELRRTRRSPERVTLDSQAEADDPSPLEVAVGRQGLERYERGLAALKTMQREAVIARVEMGCTYPAIAEMLDLPSAEAARKTVERAIVQLAQEIRTVETT